MERNIAVQDAPLTGGLSTRCHQCADAADVAMRFPAIPSTLVVSLCYRHLRQLLNQGQVALLDPDPHDSPPAKMVRLSERCVAVRSNTTPDLWYTVTRWGEHADSTYACNCAFGRVRNGQGREANCSHVRMVQKEFPQ